MLALLELRLENVMRFTTVGAAVGLTLLTVSTALHGQRPDSQIDPKSLALLQEAKAARAAGNLERATDLLETSVAVDPRNRQSFIVMAEVSRDRGLPGKAIRLYREALTLEPNDVVALAGQGEALVAKGATARAKENLAKVKALCPTGCVQLAQLAAAIDKGPPVSPATVAQTTPSKTTQQQ